MWVSCESAKDLTEKYFEFLESDINEIQNAAISNLLPFCKVFDLATIQKVVFPNLIRLFEDPSKNVPYKQKVLETMFGLTVFEDNDVINPTLTGFFHSYINHTSFDIRISLMFLVKDNIKLISPIHILENACVSQIAEIYDNCNLDQKLQMISVIKLLIQNVEYLFHNHQFLKILKDKFLSDELYIVRISMLKIFIEMKDFIGLKVFEKRLLGMFIDLGNSPNPDHLQIFCYFVIVL